jgi:hypothetical protein
LNRTFSQRKVEIKSPCHSEATMKPVQRSNLTRATDVATLEEQIRLRAYALYEARSCEDGHDLDDWLKAEAEILGTRRKATAA